MNKNLRLQKLNMLENEYNEKLKYAAKNENYNDITILLFELKVLRKFYKSN
jgi:hypothetical protein